MYEHFFELHRKPFDLLPNPDFLYMSASHKRALSYLDYGIRERMGFILLTGEVGSGKTTIIRNLIAKHHNNVVLSKIFNTRVDSEQLIAMINDDFGLDIKDKDRISQLRDLNSFLIDQFVKGNQPVLIIDEAQNLDHDLLEEIRMLSNLETDNTKLMQIILVGQPELRKTLAATSLIQLRQRISINCHIHPLSRIETEQYVLHRLEKAGNRSAISFSPETMEIIHTYSRGIPRLINIIGDFIMLAAFAEETKQIDSRLVLDIIGDLDFEHHYWGNESGNGDLPVASEIGATDLSGSSSKVFSSVIKEIHKRLDSLNKTPDVSNQKHLQEITARVSDIEQILKSQQEKTGSIIKELQKRSVQASAGSTNRIPANEQPVNFMNSMFGRMLRSRISS